MSADRTEKPTGKRLQDARKKGQVARSRDLAQAGSLLATVLALGWTGQRMMVRLSVLLAAGLRRPGDWAMRTVTVQDLTGLAVNGVATVAWIAAPLAGVAIVAAVAVHAAQGGLVVATESLQMNWARLNPASGIKRLGLSTGGLELVRMLLATSVLAYISWHILTDHMAGASTLSRIAPADAAQVMWSNAIRLLKQAGIATLLLGGADYLVQRQKLMQSLRMTRQEVRDEAKMLEGNPQIKAKVRAIQRNMARRRMLTAAKKATVVITNPTHFAIALQYRRDSMSAPLVLAKGQGHVAQRIKAVAREHGIPMVENVTLARALYGSADVGEVIPGALFEAVAEVLAYLIKIKQLVL